MKIKLLFVLALVLFHPLFSDAAGPMDGGSFSLEGRISPAMDSVVLSYPDDDGIYQHLSKPVNDGRFTMKGAISQPVFASLMFKRRGEVIPREKIESRSRQFYLEPALMTVSGDPGKLEQLQFTGSKAEQDYEQLLSFTRTVREEMKPVEEAFMNEKDPEKAAELHTRLDPYFNRIKKETYRFFLENPASYVTLDQFRYYLAEMHLDSVNRVYNALPTALKTTQKAQLIQKEIGQIEQGMPGAEAHPFSKNDIHGKALSLANFKGKYIMLDFWASWCVPCRKRNPHMISLYHRYKEKGLVIIGIADDDNSVTAWLKAVEKDGIGIWYHVLRGYQRGAHKSIVIDDLNGFYGIHSIPTKILINPEGKIIGRFGDAYGGNDADMDKMLVKIFGE